jgi:hypothetical protein
MSLPDEELYRRFDSAHLPAGEFGHPEHVRAAFLYLRRHPDFGEAAVRFRRALRRFAAAHGVPRKYHETLTWAYLVLIRERMQHGHPRTSQGFLRQNLDLLDHRHGPLARYYDVDEITRSDLARHLFLLPDGDRRKRRVRTK